MTGFHKAILSVCAFSLIAFTSCGGSGSDEPSASSHIGSVTVTENTLSSCLELVRGTSQGFTTHTRTVTHHTTSAKGTPIRNYTVCYDMSQRLPMYVAYPMHNVYIGPQARTNAWQADPSFSSSEQADLESGMHNGHDRGHMISSASRTCSRDANEQTFYYTNMSPQLNSFNAERWVEAEMLERAWRNGGVSTATVDTLYVVTGPVLQTVGGSEDIQYITNGNDNKQIARPKYFYKVFLKRFHDNALSNKVTYRALGMWFKHEALSGPVQASDCRSVDEIEALTGLDFFYNLPDNIEDVVEAKYDLDDWRGVVQ